VGLAAAVRVGRASRAGARGAAAAACLALLAGPLARAELPVETIGRVESLPRPASPHWIWVADGFMQRTALVDLDGRGFLGQLNSGWGVPLALLPRRRAEVYLPETYYSRATRGERTDVVTVYDAFSLAPVAEVVVPPRRAHNPLPTGNSALSDDDRFLALFNLTPATSLSIVDLEARRFTAEIATPGCSLVYGAGPRRFAMLCADGSLLAVTLDEEGREAARWRSAPFFDPEADPVTEKAVRHRDQWIFVSFEGVAHPVDVSGPEPRFPEPWSLLDARDREESWRIGGAQHLAVHGPTGRFYSLVHQGGVDTHKDPGSELWVYDLARRARVQRIELKNPGFTFMGLPLEFGRDWIWPLSGLYDFLLDHVIPNPGISQVHVTQDERPLLVTGSFFTGSLAVYDALSGEFLRRVPSGNATVQGIQAPAAGGGGSS
jgi:methylamine dehydrogenase heavy chain